MNVRAAARRDRERLNRREEAQASVEALSVIRQQVVRDTAISYAHRCTVDPFTGKTCRIKLDAEVEFSICPEERGEAHTW